ncbi:hypothetical protein HaLaN_02083, partial [Haematococcus lacustris]
MQEHQSWEALNFRRRRPAQTSRTGCGTGCAAPSCSRVTCCLHITHRAVAIRGDCGAQAEDLVGCRLGGVREVDAQDPAGPELGLR